MKEYNIQGAFNFAEAVASDVSGHIGIINQSNLPTLTKMIDGTISSDLKSVSKGRWRGDFRKRDSVWGLKESAKSSFYRVSNAACLAGDLLSFYIEPEGHGVGLLDGETIFSKSELEITVYDIIRGKSNSLVFSDFSLPANSPGRFISLKIPDEDADYGDYFFSDNGMCGLFLMRIREIVEFHHRADWTDTFTYDQNSTPRYNDSFVQIAIYPWNLSLREFDFSSSQQNSQISSLSRFIIDDVDPTDDEIDVFEHKTYFPSFRRISGTELVELRKDEKKHVIRKNTMALISSQLPILNASVPQAPVLGVGMAEANNTNANEIDPISRPRAWESRKSESNSASLFSLTGIPPLINTLSGLNDFSKNNNQLSSKARNPVRTFLSNPDSQLTQLSFALFGQNVSGISGALNTEESETSILLNEENQKTVNVYVETRQANSPYTSSKSSTLSDFSNSSRSSSSSSSTSEDSGSSVSYSSLSSSVEGDSIVISFDTEIPDNLIKSVSFAFSINNFDFKVFTDDTGTLRENIFYAEDYDISLSKDDVVYGRIGIEDENGIVTYWYSEYNIPIEHEKLSITDFRTKTRTDGSGVIDFYFNLQAPVEILDVYVQFSISPNGGLSWENPTNMTGDVGTVPIGQNRHISWNLLEYNSLYAGTVITAKLTISSPTGTQIIGRKECGSFMIESKKDAYILKHTEGVKRGIYNNEDVKNPFLKVRESIEVVGSSSSISGNSSESSLSNISSVNSSSSDSTTVSNDISSSSLDLSNYYSQTGKICCSINGDKIFVLESSLLGDSIYYSDDSGNSWQRKTPDFDMWFARDICCSSDGTKFAISTGNENIVTGSINGTDWTWTKQINSGKKSWGVIKSSGLGDVILSIPSFTTDIYISTDYGITWNQRNIPGIPSNYLYGAVGMSKSGDMFIGTANTGFGLFKSDNNGIDWTWLWPNFSDLYWWTRICSSDDGTRIYAIANQFLFTSSNSGASFNATGAGSIHFDKISCSSSGSTVITSVYNGCIWVSTDYGATWTERISSGSKAWDGIVCSGDGNKIFATVMSGSSVFVSYDAGITWIEKAIGI